MAVCQNLVPLVNIKIAGKWMFIPLKMVLIGIDPYPNGCSTPTSRVEYSENLIIFYLIHLHSLIIFNSWKSLSTNWCQFSRMGSHRPWHSVVPNSGKRRQWFLCHSFRCQQRSVGWNSARVNGSLPEYVATVVKYIFTIRRFEQHFLFYPSDYKGAIAQSIKPARLISGATGHLFQVPPGSLPGFQSLELLAWQPPLETTGWLGGQLGLGMHRHLESFGFVAKLGTPDQSKDH